jgi:hypothetical protein
MKGLNNKHNGARFTDILIRKQGRKTTTRRLIQTDGKQIKGVTLMK